MTKFAPWSDPKSGPENRSPREPVGAITAGGYAETAQRLQEAARVIAALAEAAAVIAGPSAGDPSGCPDRTP